MEHAPLRSGDRVLVHAARALGIRVPGPPRNVTGDGEEWLPGSVERVRADGWVMVSLDAGRVFDEAARRVAAPSDAVQPLDR
jgi:hypothetical protein